MSTVSTDKWREGYQKALDNPPTAGMVLETIDGSPIRVTVELLEGSPPFLYTRMYVPEAVGMPTQWFVQSTKQVAQHGWKCIVLPHARQRIIAQCGLDDGFIAFEGKLRVVRESRTRKSILVEVY